MSHEQHEVSSTDTTALQSSIPVDNNAPVSTSTMLDSANALTPTTCTFASSDHSLVNPNIMGTMLDPSMMAAVNHAVRGTNSHIFGSLPTMALKYVDTQSQSSESSFQKDDERELESNEEGEEYEESEVVDGVRKSERKRKPARPKSPEEEPFKFKRKRKKSHRLSMTGPQGPVESSFKCDKCASPYVTNPARRGNKIKTSTHQASPRHKIDPITGKTLTLCNACGKLNQGSR